MHLLVDLVPVFCIDLGMGTVIDYVNPLSTPYSFSPNRGTSLSKKHRKCSQDRQDSYQVLYTNNTILSWDVYRGELLRGERFGPFAICTSLVLTPIMPVDAFPLFLDVTCLETLFPTHYLRGVPLLQTGTYSSLTPRVRPNRQGSHIK